MPAKTGQSSQGHLMHYTVAAVIKRGGKILMIDRKIFPLGYASLAGHIDTGETPDEALRREVAEESGLAIKSQRLIFEEEVDGNVCSRGIVVHYWYVWECECEGEPELFPLEEKSIGWYAPEEIKKLTLEPVWEYWFKKMNII